MSLEHPYSQVMLTTTKSRATLAHNNFNQCTVLVLGYCNNTKTLHPPGLHVIYEDVHYLLVVLPNFPYL